MKHQLRIAIVAAGCLLARDMHGQATTPNPVGVWRGTSLCLVRPSPCRDERVVYRITRPNDRVRDSISVDARKVVSGQEEEMGVLECRFVAPSAQLTCTIPNGAWHFTIHGDSLTGELRLPNGTKFRDVRTHRAAP